MTRTYTSLALSRTATTNVRRLYILGGFVVAMVLAQIFWIPVPDPVFGVFALWLIAVVIYQTILSRAHTSRQANTLQAVAFGVDITFLTLIYGAFGGAWWMSATVHSVVATAAFASLPRGLARYVAGYAALAFVALMVSQAAGLTERLPFFEVSSLEGRYQFTAAATMFGLLALLAGTYIQDTFVRIMRRSHEQHRVILQTAPVMIVTTDLNGLMTSANEATYVLTGRTHTDVIGLPFIRYTHPDDLALTTSHIAATLAGESRQFELRYLAADGSAFWLLCSCNAIRDDAEITGLLLIGRDITDRKRSEEQLRSHEALLAETQRLTHLGSWEWDLRADQVKWSDELYRIFGMRRNGPLTFEMYLAKVYDDDRQMVHGIITEALARREPFSFDHRVIRPDGEIRMLHAVGHVVLGEGDHPVKMIGSAQDTTEQSALTEQLRQAQKMEAVGQLAGGVAHDFNNILTIIGCHTQFLLQTIPDGDMQKTDVEAIQHAAQNAAQLTRQLLAFSRKQILQPRLLEVNESVSSIEKLLSRVLSENISVFTNLDPDCGLVRADPSQLEQVLMNLAVNARDAMPNGGALHIGTRHEVLSLEKARLKAGLQPGPHVVLTVRDTGDGMSAEVKARVFEPFFTTKGLGQGTGLGLATVYGIVKQSGGNIHVESAPARGTTFTIYLPESSETETGSYGIPVVPIELRGSETILVVEDAAALRDVIHRILTGHGYNVVSAENGAAALAVYEKSRAQIDLLLTDVVMPELGGRELAARLLAERPSLPVIFMSGYTETAALGRHELPGGNDFVGKPFTPETLLRHVRTVLDRKRRHGVRGGSLSSLPAESGTLNLI